MAAPAITLGRLPVNCSGRTRARLTSESGWPPRVSGCMLRRPLSGAHTCVDRSDDRTFPALEVLFMIPTSITRVFEGSARDGACPRTFGFQPSGTEDRADVMPRGASGSRARRLARLDAGRTEPPRACWRLGGQRGDGARLPRRCHGRRHLRAQRWRRAFELRFTSEANAAIPDVCNVVAAWPDALCLAAEVGAGANRCRARAAASARHAGPTCSDRTRRWQGAGCGWSPVASSAPQGRQRRAATRRRRSDARSPRPGLRAAPAASMVGSRHVASRSRSASTTAGAPPAGARGS